MTKPTYRQHFVSEMERLEANRNCVLNRLQFETAPEEHRTLVFIIEMLDADIMKYKRAIATIDGKITTLEFMEWFIRYMAWRRDRLVCLREIIEAHHGNGEFDSPESQEFFEFILQNTKDELLIEAHNCDQFEAAMGEAYKRLGIKPPKPDTDSVKYYGRFPIRCGQCPDGNFVLNANDTVAVLRIINGEIECMDQQPELDAEMLAEEMQRVIVQYRYTPETQDFRRWSIDVL